MTAKVSAEGNDVATTTSEHYAHSTEPDIRLVNQKDPKPLKNWQKTDKLGDKRSQKTKFGGGWVWRTSTKLGPPSEPVDGWPGQKNGGKVNAEIEAAKGAGAKKVWVEKEVVLRHTDKTEQNAGNSKGIIDAKAGWEAYMKKAEADPDAALGHGASAKASTDASTDPNQKKRRDGNGQDGQTGGGGDVAADCYLDAVTMTHHGRAQRGPAKSKSSKIEVVPDEDKQVALVAAFRGSCKEHPKWTATEGSGKALKGVSVEGTKATVTVAREAASAWTEIDAWRKAFAAKPETVVVVCTGHAGNFQRTIDVYPAGQTRVVFQLAKLVPEGVHSTARVVGNILARLLAVLDVVLGLKFHDVHKVGPSIDLPEGFEVLKGEIEVKTLWKNDHDWRAYCLGSVESKEMVLFAGELVVGGNLVEVALAAVVACLAGPEAGPLGKFAGKYLVEIVNKLWKLVTGHDFIFGGPFVRLKVDLGTRGVTVEKTYYPSGGSPEHKVGGKVEMVTTIDVGINYALDEDIVAVEGSFGHSGTSEDSVTVESEHLVLHGKQDAISLHGRVRLKYNFTKWSAVGLLAVTNPPLALALLAFKKAGGELDNTKEPLTASFDIPVIHGAKLRPIRIPLVLPSLSVIVVSAGGPLV